MSDAITLTVAFAGAWLTSNPRSTVDWYGRARQVRAWRDATVIACHAARAPHGITPVRISMVARSTGRAPVRDSMNLYPTVKAIVDGLTPRRVITRGKRVYVTPGYGLLPDDDDRHVLGHPTWTLEHHGGQPCVLVTIAPVVGV